MPRDPHIPFAIGLAIALAMSVTSCATPSVDAMGLVATSTERCEQTITPAPPPDPTAGMTDEESTAYWIALEIADTWSNDAGTVINALQLGFPDDYATARVLQSEMAFQVGFFGEVPVGALAILATSTVPYFVDENLGFTEIGIDALNTAVGEITSDLVVSSPARSVGPLPFERTIRVGFALGEDNDAGQDTCRSIDPDAIAVAIGDRLAEDGVDTFGFTIDVYTYWGEGVEFH